MRLRKAQLSYKVSFLQIAARIFGIPVCKIHISETSTNTVANTSPTAASASSDLNGMAVKVKHLFQDGKGPVANALIYFQILIT